MQTKFNFLKPKKYTSIILLIFLMLGSVQEAEAKFIGWEETGVSFGPISSPTDAGQCVTYVQFQYIFFGLK